MKEQVTRLLKGILILVFLISFELPLRAQYRSSTDHYFKSAKEAYNTSNYNKAVDLFKSAIVQETAKAKPKNITLGHFWRWLGYAYEKAHLYEDALVSFDESAKFYRIIDSYENLAQSYRDQVIFSEN